MCLGRWANASSSLALPDPCHMYFAVSDWTVEGEVFGVFVF